MRDEGSAVAGSNYTLICEVTIPMFSGTTAVSEAFVTWTYPSGETHAFRSSAQIVLSPVTSDDDGVYTCTAHYLADGIASPQGSDSHEVSVSKSLCVSRSASHKTDPWFHVLTSVLRSWRSVSECNRLWIRRSWFSLHSHLHSHTPPQS